MGSQILWFRRDLRITDSALLSCSKGNVLPIFIFDKNILGKLPSDDKRVSFIYKSVLNLKQKLKNIGLDLAIFYDEPSNVFKKLKSKGFDEVLCSIDFDSYAKKRDEEIETIIPVKRYLDSFILNPIEHLKADSTPYKVFTPFYKSLNMITSSNSIETYKRNEKLLKIEFEYDLVPTLEDMGFKEQLLPSFLLKDAYTLLDEEEKNKKK